VCLGITSVERRAVKSGARRCIDRHHEQQWRGIGAGSTCREPVGNMVVDVGADTERQ